MMRSAAQESRYAPWRSRAAPGRARPRRPALGRRRLAWSTLAALRREPAGADVAIAHGAQTLPACALATLAARGAVRLPPDQRLACSGRRRRCDESESASGLSRAARVVALWEGAATTLNGTLRLPGRIASP